MEPKKDETDEYKKFFDDVKNFLDKQTKQKQRGLNNYNILTSVLQSHDEMRLHTRMIYSFLNPTGEHFQETLFLEVLKISDFLDLLNCSVYKEYNKKIDLYITDGNKHIIIENKVYAGDQFEQIKRYIEIIQEENEGLQADDILVVYLSLDRKVPSKESLGNLEINDNYLKKGNENIARYESIFYKNEILKWLKKCQHEVQNITNLNEVFRQYIDVVKIINNQSKDKVMSLSNYLKKDESTYKMAMEIHKSLPETREGIVQTFIKNELKDYLQNELDEEWTVEEWTVDAKKLSKRWNVLLKIYKSNWLNQKKNNLIFAFEFNENNYIDGAFGVVRLTTNIKIKDDIIKTFKNDLKNINFEVQTSAWWLHWEFLPDIEGKDDFAEYLFFDKNAKEDIKNRILEIINIFEKESGLLTKINNYLNEKENQT